jgi:hypothetical protein
VTRPCLNGKPIFLAGWLDQSFWPDGQYTGKRTGREPAQRPIFPSCRPAPHAWRAQRPRTTRSSLMLPPSSSLA